MDVVFFPFTVCPRPPERQWISLQPDRTRNPACEFTRLYQKCGLSRAVLSGQQPVIMTGKRWLATSMLGLIMAKEQQISDGRCRDDGSLSL